MEVCDLLHKGHAGDPQTMGADAACCLVYQNNQIARCFWPVLSSGLAIGAPANMISVDYRPLALLHTDDVPRHLLFSVHGGIVTTPFATVG
jgi:hypothetical protein